MSPADEPTEDLAAELRALYRRLEPSRPADEAADADPETAHVVRWMQGAWNALDVPNVTVPSVTAPPARVPRAHAKRRDGRRTVRRLLLAAAAALLLLAGSALWRALSTRAEPARPTRVAQVPPRPPAKGVEVLVVRPDQVELRSGSVRLVLLDPPPESSPVPPGE